MRILETGADRFIGSHLVGELVRIGGDVCAFVFYSSSNSWGWLDPYNGVKGEFAGFQTGIRKVTEGS